MGCGNVFESSRRATVSNLWFVDFPEWVAAMMHLDDNIKGLVTDKRMTPRLEIDLVQFLWVEGRINQMCLWYRIVISGTELTVLSTGSSLPQPNQTKNMGRISPRSVERARILVLLQFSPLLRRYLHPFWLKDDVEREVSGAFRGRLNWAFEGSQPVREVYEDVDTEWIWSRLNG